jgi:hypothetical protein
MSKKKLPKQRRRLWETNPHCHWCGIKTVWYAEARGGAAPPDAATLDHLHPRHHPDRLMPADGALRHVLSCSKCNNERDTRERAALPKEWFYERGCGKPLALQCVGDLEKALMTLRANLLRRPRNRKSVEESIAKIEAELSRRLTESKTPDSESKADSPTE